MSIDWKALGQKAKELLKTAGEKGVQVAAEIRQQANQAAEAVAAR
jgi:ElaB/YqjD/DUF883 family membrane-anchored ribosome-binding protein